MMETTDNTAATPGQVVGGDGVEDVDHGPGVAGAARHLLRGLQPLENTHNGTNRTCSVKMGIFMVLPLLRCCGQPANNATDEVTLPSQFCRRGTSKTNCKV